MDPFPPCSDSDFLVTGLGFGKTLGCADMDNPNPGANNIYADETFERLFPGQDPVDTCWVDEITGTPTTWCYWRNCKNAYDLYGMADADCCKCRKLGRRLEDGTVVRARPDTLALAGLVRTAAYDAGLCFGAELVEQRLVMGVSSHGDLVVLRYDEGSEEGWSVPIDNAAQCTAWTFDGAPVFGCAEGAAAPTSVLPPDAPLAPRISLVPVAARHTLPTGCEPSAIPEPLPAATWMSGRFGIGLRLDADNKAALGAFPSSRTVHQPGGLRRRRRCVQP